MIRAQPESRDEMPTTERVAGVERAPAGPAGARRDSVKRLFDVVFAGAALVLLSPLIVGTAVAVRLRLGSPVLFRQERPGLHAKPFTMVKFRSMLNAVDEDGQPLEDIYRMTPFGRRLRSMSLDELPELWNVLRGDMSLVGPRPLLMRYVGRYTPEQMRRHEVRPGITGLAQVGGRNALTWEQKFGLDLRYVDEHDLRMDLSILWRTLKVVVLREGIRHDDEGGDDMPEYMGSAATDQGD
jgi:lipopolysaccharide/colanic/teichoic acid biosynthesis glycosyltransferase